MHAATMKKIIDYLTSNGKEIRSDQYIYIFLKFIQVQILTTTTTDTSITITTTTSSSIITTTAAVTTKPVIVCVNLYLLYSFDLVYMHYSITGGSAYH